MRRLALLVVLAAACTPAPYSEGPTMTVQERVAQRAAEDRAEASRRMQERQAAVDAQQQRAVHERAQRQAEVDAQREAGDRARRSALETDCATDRAERLARLAAIRAEATENERKHDAAVEWAEAHCRRVMVDDTRRVLCDDGSSVAKICTEKTGGHEEYRCPPGAPKGVTPLGVTTGRTVAESPLMLGPHPDSARNQRCAPVDAADAGAP